MSSERIENVIIVGSGPAGYTAALYTARANLEPLVAEGFAWGGLLQQTTDVENYPGFPDGIMGPEMMQRFRDQAERFGAKLVTDEVDRVELATEPGGVHKVFVGDDEHRARTVILAMGADMRPVAGPVLPLEHLAGHFEPVQPGHLDVQEDQVGGVLVDQRQRVDAIGRLGRYQP